MHINKETYLKKNRSYLRHCKTDKDETYRQTEKKTEENRLKYRDLKAETLRERVLREHTTAGHSFIFNIKKNT